MTNEGEPTVRLKLTIHWRILDDPIDLVKVMANG